MTILARRWALAWLVCMGMAHGQERVTAPLRIEMGAPEASALTLLFYGDRAGVRKSTAPGGLALEISPSEDGALLLRAGEQHALLGRNSSTRLTVKQRGTQALPYEVHYQAAPDESFTWSPAYHAAGILRSGNCTLPVKVLDLDGDGAFDRHDAALGPNVLVGERAEPYQPGELISWCGGVWELDGLSADGSSISWRRSSLMLPRVGETVPRFSLYDFQGGPVSWAAGEPVLLDFWASWCSVCVENFSALGRLEGKLRVVSVNLDEQERLPRVQALLKRMRPQWAQAMTSEGRDSAIWRAFGSLPGVHLSLPLYVLVGADGRISAYGSNLSAVVRLADDSGVR